MKGLVDCSKVFVENSATGGAGAFAAVAIAKGELVEAGIVRRLPAGFDGHVSPHVFTWSEDRTVWAIGSGCSTFYNTSDDPNTRLERFYDEDRFEIFALRDIEAGEEFTHIYKSLRWRACFGGLAD
jgi:SET domain-containing protein